MVIGRASERRAPVRWAWPDEVWGRVGYVATRAGRLPAVPASVARSHDACHWVLTYIQTDVLVTSGRCRTHWRIFTARRAIHESWIYNAVGHSESKTG